MKISYRLVLRIIFITSTELESRILFIYYYFLCLSLEKGGNVQKRKER